VLKIRVCNEENHLFFFSEVDLKVIEEVDFIPAIELEVEISIRIIAVVLIIIIFAEVTLDHLKM
jgi:hypothetical protein